MADLIKKIKIKKQDGTFTDYIPIGAEAQNVSTSDGDSVQLKLNKKPYYYNNIADMKADTKLKAGDMAVTLGYYEANDGGGAEYRIINNEYTDDGGSYHKINNNLFAELIIRNDTINFKQFGAKSEDFNNILYDNSIYLQKVLNFINTTDKRIQLLIPSGIWGFSPTDIYTTKGITIIGERSFSLYKWDGTIIVPFENNQEYVWQIGKNDSLNTHSIFIKNLIFSSAYFLYSFANKDFYLKTLNQEGYVGWDSMKQITTTFLKIKYVTNSNFENIYFRYIRGQCMEIGSSWECYFPYLNFRHVFNLNGPIICFKECDNTAYSHSNLTALSFEYIMMEAFKGIPFYCETHCNFAHSHFGTINIEDFAENITPNCTYELVTSNNFDNNNAIHIPIFKLEREAQFSAIDVNNLELNNFAYRYFTINNQQYVYDTIMDMQYGITTPLFNNIEVIGTGKDTILLHYDDIQNYCSKHASFTINNFTTDNIDCKPIFDIRGFSSIKTNIKIPNSIARSNYSEASNLGYLPFYKVKANMDSRTFQNLYSDNECLNDLQLAVQTVNTVLYPTVNRLEVRLPITGLIFNMRYKVPTGNIGNLALKIVDSENTMIGQLFPTGDVQGTGKYQWLSVDLSSKITTLDKDYYMYIYPQDNKNGNCYLDCYYFI